MNNRNFPNLLVISHNLLESNNNVGKTLLSLLSKWPKNCLYSLYFRNEYPTLSNCNSYFLLHDKDVIKALLSIGLYKSGKSFSSIQSEYSITDKEKFLYRLGNKRMPIISLIRDLIWKISPWKTSKLESWIYDIHPQIILFVPSDYSLAFNVLNYIRNITDARIFTFYMDDLFYYKQSIKGIEKIRRKKLLKLGQNCAKYTESLFTTCNLMADEYEKLLHLKCQSFGNCVEFIDDSGAIENGCPESLVLSYIGNLHSNRWMSLVEIGQALETINNQDKKEHRLDIYSANELEKNIKLEFEAISCVYFMGALSPDEVREKQRVADILVHVEAFDIKSKISTRLSVSTKIFEYLAVGKPIFAYGPEDIASIKYLEETNAAQICTNKSDLIDKLIQVFESRDLLKVMREQGVKYALNHCNCEVESEKFCKALTNPTLK